MKTDEKVDLEEGVKGLGVVATAEEEEKKERNE